MKNNLKHTFLLASLLIVQMALGQNKDQVNIPTLPKLENLLNHVVNSNYRVKEEADFVRHYQEGIELSRKAWMDKIFLDFGYQRANNGAILDVNNNVSENQFNSVSFQNLNSLRAGVIVRLSLFDAFGRKHLVKEAEHRVGASQNRLYALQTEAKFKIVDLYKDAELAYKLISIKSEKKYALFLQNEMAEKEFEQGQLHIAELGRITELASNANAEFESIKSVYQKLYRQLELEAGVPLSTLF